MKIVFHINHPAQYHMLKNVIQDLKKKDHEITIIGRNKDVLTQLMDSDGVTYFNAHKSPRESNLVTLLTNHALQYLRIKKLVKKLNPDLLVGTSFIFPHISRKLNIPYINIVEDDAKVIPLYGKFSLAKSDYIFAPEICQLGKWETKKIPYNSYHELAFLHPNHFNPDMEVASKYINISENNFLIRFTEFSAHHDYGKKGIDLTTAQQIIDNLSKHGNIFISSERHLPENLTKYKLTIDPKDIHHLMSYCKLVIGDSQSMAMEAACLGVPSIRFNDYAGRISVLEELERDYSLTFAFTPNRKKEMLLKIQSLLNNSDLKEIFQNRKNNLINDKSDTQELLTWLIDKFPDSLQKLKEEPRFLVGNNNKKKMAQKEYTLRKGKTSMHLIISSIYLITLLVLYLYPFSDKISLNHLHYATFRVDHIIHLLVFAPIPFLILPLFLKKSNSRIFRAVLTSLIFAFLFELTHLILSYRAFTFEDLSANVIGVVLGGTILSLIKHTQFR